MKTIRYLSLFTGIGGFDLGFFNAHRPVPWREGIDLDTRFECVGMVEVDPDCQNLLKTYFPDIPLYGDITDVGHGRTHPLPANIDCLVGGFPCQDLSLAGQRKGLAGARSGLWYEFHRLIAEARPKFVIIENVRGLLSSGPPISRTTYQRQSSYTLKTTGRTTRPVRHARTGLTEEDNKRPKVRRGIDFAIILAGLTGTLPRVPDTGWRTAGAIRGRPGAYHVAWRVLDTQYFNLPQRRQRVFIIASLGTGSCAQILFESESGQRVFAPGAEAEEADPPVASERATGDSFTVLKRRGGYGLSVLTDVAGTVETGGTATGGHNSHQYVFGSNNYSGPVHVTSAVNAHGSRRYDLDTENLVVAPRIFAQNTRDELRWTDKDIAGSLAAEPGAKQQSYVVFDPHTTGSARTRVVRQGDYAQLKTRPDAIAFTLRTSAEGRQLESQAELAYAVTDPGGGGLSHSRSIAHNQSARRLTPLECERLQGFPDGWTAVPSPRSLNHDSAFRAYLLHTLLNSPFWSHFFAGQEIEPNDLTSDTQRYRQTGNAVSVNVAWWLGRQLLLFHNT